MDQPTGSEVTGIDTEQPNVARIYDYVLGGAHNFAADREVADQLLAADPSLRATARANRDVLRRFVVNLVESGIDQFLDIGSGIPTVGNVHEIAQARNPEARVVYTDLDPLAVSHGNQILAGNPNATSILADFRRVDDILNHPTVHAMLDFTRPVGVLMVALLHYMADEDDPAGAVARVGAAVPAGSYLALSHITADLGSGAMDNVVRVTERTPTTAHLRTHAEITALFGPFTPLEPGLVPAHRWRPDGEVAVVEDDDPAISSLYAGLGRKD